MFIGDLPLTSAISDNDILVGCIGGTAKVVSYATLKSGISAEIGTWDGLGGKPFDTIDSTYLRVYTETVDDVVIKKLSFSTDFITDVTAAIGSIGNMQNDIAELQDTVEELSTDSENIKGFIGYSGSGSPLKNQSLYNGIMTVARGLGYDATYDPTSDAYIFTPSSGVNPAIISNMFGEVMSSIGYMVSFDSTTGVWKFVRHTGPETVHNIYSVLTQTLLGAIGYGYSVTGDGTLTVARNGSPYLNSDHQQWLFAILGALFATTPQYDSATKSWNLSYDYDAVFAAPASYIATAKSKIFDNNWAPLKAYDVGAVVVYNNKIYQCITAVTAGGDDEFDSTKWQELGVTQAAFDALEARVAALENP